MKFRSDIPLAPLTSLKIGGLAEHFIEVRTRDALRDAFAEARRRGLPVTILGGGTNTLIADEGIRGVVILVRLRAIRRDGDRIIAEAGTPMAEVVAASVDAGLSGLAWAGGLPGTLGGAIAGNAGTFGRTIGDVVEAVEAMLPGCEVVFLSGDACRFGYRTSIFQEDLSGAVILSAMLLLEPGEREALRREMLGAIAFRNGRHPAPSSAGSFFKNPSMPQDHRVPAPPEEIAQWFGRVPAGWLIDRAGLKGARVGGAMVAEQHANFVVNAGNATAGDVRALASFVKDRVSEKFGIVLEEEVRMLGFADAP